MISHEDALEVAPELAAHYEHSVRTVPCDRIPLPRPVQNIIDHPHFQRLRGVKQLAFADRVYPDASHSRFAHSVGVYGNAVRYTQALLNNRWSELFRDSLDSRDLRTLLIAALVHDIGQYPFAHAIEDSVRRGGGQVGVPDLDHEALTKRILLDSAFRASQLAEFQFSGPDLGLLIEQAGTSPEEVCGVLDGLGARDLTQAKAHLLRSIVDGPIDVDKLDYLRRDSHHAGVGFGLNIDVGRLLQSICVVAVPSSIRETEDLELGLIEKGVSAAEELLVARSHMFTQVYWHRTVRAHEAVLAAALSKLRRASRGLDEWIAATMLGPRAQDEDLIYQCLRVSAGRGDGSVELLQSKDERLLQLAAHRMLSSLFAFSGRAPFKRLVSISARDSRAAYQALQGIREVALGSGSIMDELAQMLAAGLTKSTGTQVSWEDIVIDIPAVRAPANTVKVLGTREPRLGRITPLYKYSSVWQRFGDGFNESMCRIRVFVPANIRQSLSESTPHYRLSAATEFLDAAISLGKRIGEQTDLGL